MNDGLRNWTLRRATEHAVDLYDEASAEERSAQRAHLLWMIEQQERDAREWEKLCNKACEQLGNHSALLKEWRSRAAIAVGVAMGAIIIDAARVFGWIK